MDLVHEIAERDRLLALRRGQELPNREKHHDEDDPEQQRLVGLLHVGLDYLTRARRISATDADPSVLLGYYVRCPASRAGFGRPYENRRISGG
jgi:hypothetical protein